MALRHIGRGHQEQMASLHNAFLLQTDTWQQGRRKSDFNADSSGPEVTGWLGVRQGAGSCGCSPDSVCRAASGFWVPTPSMLGRLQRAPCTHFKAAYGLQLRTATSSVIRLSGCRRIECLGRGVVIDKGKGTRER